MSATCAIADLSNHSRTSLPGDLLIAEVLATAEEIILLALT
jgi:hypothetical protein